MPVSTQTINVTSGYALEVFTTGDTYAGSVKVAGGDTVYYKSTSGVSATSNDGSLTSGQSANFSVPTWLISASTSQVTLTSYTGGGDLEALFASWRPVHRVEGLTLAGGTAAGQLLVTGPLATFVAAAGTATGQGMFYLDPSQFLGSLPAGNRTPKVRIRGSVTANAVAPACTNLVYALYPVATTGGASGAVPTVATVGTVVCAATLLTPSASTQVVGVSTAVAFPAAGWYVLALTVGTGGTAANANTVHGFEIQYNLTAP